LPIILGTSLAVNTHAQQTLFHAIFQSPHTLVLKGDLQINGTGGLWTEVDQAKAQGYKITSVSIDSYTATSSLSPSEPLLYETVLIVMEK
jgi:hypothetical protein